MRSDRAGLCLGIVALLVIASYPAIVAHAPIYDRAAPPTPAAARGTLLEPRATGSTSAILASQRDLPDPSMERSLVSPTGNFSLIFEGGIGPSSGAAPLNVTVFLTASGGHPPYAYRIVYGDGARGDYSNEGRSTVVHTYLTAGVFEMEITVSDAAQDRVTANETVSVVNFPLAVQSPWIFPSALDLGHTALLSTWASGGTGVYTYTWYGLPAPCRSMNSSEIECTPWETGTDLISAVVTDSAAAISGSPTAMLQVVVPPAGADVVASPGHVDLGQNFTLAVNLQSPGAPPLRYDWTDLPPGCVASDQAQLACVAGAMGTYGVIATVTDSNGVSITTAVVGLTIFPALKITPLAASRTLLETGNPLVLVTTASGGVSSYVFNWTGLPAGCFAGSNSSVTCTPSIAGNATVAVAVQDGNGNLVRSGSLDITILPAVSASLASSRSSLSVGGSTILDVRLSGGIGPFQLTYFGLPVGCTAITALELNCTPESAGTFEVVILVVDGLGGTAVVNGTLYVAPTSPRVASDTLFFVELGILVGAVLLVRVLRAQRMRRR
ncbi:MAG: PKD domain-containing protein [Thermoplasmata archaeon]|nr:PKD domain-containing protein [Thermoplasmata archaeon]